MRILLVNDDGVTAPGIKAAKRALSGLAERIVTVAPDRQRSGVSHGITLERPLTCEKIDDDTYSTSGTPADCVKFALSEIFGDKKPDLCISGINPGANIVSAVHYSGTIAAAREAAMAHVPSVAISVNNHHPKNFDAAERFLAETVAPLLSKAPAEILSRCLLNINLPDLPHGEIRGTRITPQGHAFWKDYFEKFTDPYGKQFFWMVGDIVCKDERDDIDIKALEAGYITITPLMLDMTDYALMEGLKKIFV